MGHRRSSADRSRPPVAGPYGPVAELIYEVLIEVLIKAAPLRGTAGAPATGLCVEDARPARARRRSVRHPLISSAHLSCCPALHGAVFLGDPLSSSRAPRLGRPTGVASRWLRQPGVRPAWAIDWG